VNYLQKVLGNKEVEDLMEKGIINRDASLMSVEKIVKSEKKKEKYEEEQIKKDKEALMEEVEQILINKKDKADTLLSSSQGTSVYVNVSTHLVYAEIPGEKTSLFYHYTDLVDVNLSYQNINRKEMPRKIKRGKIIPLIFSFKYEPVEEDIKTVPEEELESKVEEEKAPGKSKLSPKGKKERTTKVEESTSTIFFTEGKGKKG
jgi:hypothetical protein